MPASDTPAWRRALTLVALVVAGEAVFGLPFIVTRVFRPTMLEVFELTNLELGLAFSVYGVVAMVAYFVGGPIADRFSARRLMTLALLATAAGGVVLARSPSLAQLRLLYGWWGITTVLLFWAPLIRATRGWGGEGAQGRAYGLLDGGRGLFSALLSSLAVLVFALALPLTAELSLGDRRAAMNAVIWLFTGFTVLAGVLVWVAVPDPAESAEVRGSPRPVGGLGVVVRMPAVWLQAVIVVCAYVGYKSTDDFSLYARDAFGYDDVDAAKIGALGLWVRAVAAVAAGLIADRIDASRATAGAFALMTLGALAIAWGVPAQHWLLVFVVIATGTGVYALRGVYFALFGEAKVPWEYTGAAVGIVSFIGYTPDVFMGPLMGVVLDGAPGAAGHQHLFAIVAGVGALGFLCSLVFRRLRPPSA